MLDTMMELVRKKGFCVLATAGGGAPHCSLMAYVPAEDCRKIHMVTHRDSRKYRNLMENPEVSLLIDTRDDGFRFGEARALTVAGTLTSINRPGEAEKICGKLLTKHPSLERLLKQPDAAILSISISSFLLLDGLTKAYFEKL
jgi:nitroimidazol reductase NimA-like FMN-containing flavoprotein (pyridoxamine 5'-phosphate oxidase superfamily)